MARSFRCTVVTPTASVLDDEVTYASFPAWDGQMGIMPGRSPLLTRLGVGALRLQYPDGNSREFLIDSGFAQVQAGGLTLLTERSVAADAIDVAAAQTELADANTRVTRPRENQERVQHDQQLALAKIALGRSTRTRS